VVKKRRGANSSTASCRVYVHRLRQQLAEYSVENKISLEPTFAWWTPYVLKKRNRIIAKIKSKYWVRTHKYGIELPKSVDRAKELDHRNGNTFWWDSIMKEMKNV
jgi:hypothetical protein